MENGEQISCKGSFDSSTCFSILVTLIKAITMNKFRIIGLLTLAILFVCNWAKVNWTYSEVNEWPEQFPACSGGRQSPIDLDVGSINRLALPPLALTTSYFQRRLTGKLFNKAGVVAQFEYESCKSTSDADCLLLSGGPLKGDQYVLKQFHFHWGSDSSRGSEHTVNGFAYPAELHLVHFNTKYDESEVTSRADGIAVLGFFLDDFQRVRRQPQLFDTIEEALRLVTMPNDESDISIRLSDIFSAVPNLNEYFTYPGSLTTPPCSEAVTWIVFKTPIQVSTKLLDGLRELVSNEGTPLVDNFRPTQELANLNTLFRNGVLPRRYYKHEEP